MFCGDGQMLDKNHNIKMSKMEASEAKSASTLCKTLKDAYL